MHYQLQIPVKTRAGDFIYDGYTNRIDMRYPANEKHYRYNGVYGKKQIDRYFERHHCLKSLTLQLTRRCNMRCTYCVYSGSFGKMHAHTNESMDLSTIHQSIDFFEAHSRENKNVFISFYGGEALLEFALIEEAVAYANQKLSDRTVEFGITSNGLLLNETTIQFLIKHPNVQIQITLNGNMHDAFRKTILGEGSLQAILKNIERVRCQYPQVWEKQIQFIANITSCKDILPLKNFYKTIVQKLPDLITRITMDGCISNITQLFEYNRTEDLCLENELRKIYVETNDPFLAKLYTAQLQTLHERPILTESAGLAINPTCSPMSHGIFVHTDGMINICERVTDNISFGNVYDGFDDGKIDAVYDAMSHFVERNCMNCWAQHLCLLCFQNVMDETGRIKDRISEDWCKLSQEYIRRDLQSYIEIMHFDPKRFGSTL